MLSQAERNQIIDLINREVVPAIGCTEPIAVALCTARAAETLGGEPEKITVRLSANILKNAMGVGIPGTGMIGLPIAVALGALVGRSEYQLEVLCDVTPEAVERGRRMIDGRRIAICLKEDVDEKLYIEAEAEAAGHRAVHGGQQAEHRVLQADVGVGHRAGDSDKAPQNKEQGCADADGNEGFTVRVFHDSALLLILYRKSFFLFRKRTV